MSPYIKQAVEACALPIKVSHGDHRAEILYAGENVLHNETISAFTIIDEETEEFHRWHGWKTATEDYLELRHRLLSERKE